ncbi:hypothetical protein D0Y65_013517 [Glycine soja]|uniref:Uncharacterized protein n=1 Tax=Glycine soja TaxID=3848 RepID=A0A445K406_GLYSO|nr:hypothetical protein D0Y65_013517 [Glycine soja]
MVDSSDIIDKLIKRIHPDYDLNAQEENKWRYYVLLIILRLLGCIQLSLFFTASSLTNSYPLTKLHIGLHLMSLLGVCGAITNCFYLLNHLIISPPKVSGKVWWGCGYVFCVKEILADLAVFGVLRPIHHLKSGRDIIEHALIGKWFSEMDLAVGQSSRVSEHS